MGFEDDFPNLKEGGGYHRFFTNNPTSYLERNFNDLYKAAEKSSNAKPQPGERFAVCMSGYITGEMQGDALGVTAAKRVVIRPESSPEPFVSRQLLIWFVKGVGDIEGDHWTSQIPYPGSGETHEEILDYILECPFCYAESEDVAGQPVGFLDILSVYQRSGVYYYRTNTGQKFEDPSRWFWNIRQDDNASTAFSGPNAGGPLSVMEKIKETGCEDRICGPFERVGEFGDPDHEKVKKVPVFDEDGEQLQDDDGNLVFEEEVATTDGLPCSSLVAIWVMYQLGMQPVESKITDWGAWSNLDKVMWNAINMVGGSIGQTTNIHFIQSYLGGTVADYPRAGEEDSSGNVKTPKLTKGRWHVIQRWDFNNDWGHTYLIYYDGGSTVRKVQSSRKHEYRDNNPGIDKWYQKGAQEMVLTLPFGMKEIPLSTFFTTIQADEQ